MPPVFGPVVAVADPLVVLRRRHRDRPLAVAQREQRQLLAVEVLLDDDRRRSPKRRSTRNASSAARASRLVGGDDHALAGGEPVGLEHDRVALDRRHARLDGRRRPSGRAVGTPAASITSLANALVPSSRAAAALGPKRAMPGLGERVDEAGDQRRLRPDDRQVDALARAPPRRAPRRRRRATSSRRASAAMPALPGAQSSSGCCGERAARARSRARGRRRRRRGPRPARGAR